MLTYAIMALMAVGIVLFMVWGDDGPMWKNFLGQAGMLALIASVIGAVVWVGTYGS